MSLENGTTVDINNHNEEEEYRELLDGFQKRVLREATEENQDLGRPTANCIAKIHYVTMLANGTVVDSSRDRGEPFEFMLGEGSVIKAWDLAVASMYTGEKASFVCSSYYCDTSNVNTTVKIPQGEPTLRFEIELISWIRPIDPATTPEEEGNNEKKTPEEQERDAQVQEEVIRFSTKLKEEGNAFYKEKQYKNAKMKYESAARFLHPERNKELVLPLLLNLAAVNIQLGEHTDAIENCTKALQIDPSNAKALYRRGKAYKEKQYLTEAKEDLLKAATLAPDDKQVRIELEQIRQIEAEIKAKERKMFSGMFDKAELYPEIKAPNSRPQTDASRKWLVLMAASVLVVLVAVLVMFMQGK